MRVSSKTYNITLKALRLNLQIPPASLALRLFGLYSKSISQLKQDKTGL